MSVLHIRSEFKKCAEQAAHTLVEKRKDISEIPEMEDYFVALEGFVVPEGYEEVFRFNAKKRGFVVYLDTRLDS